MTENNDTENDLLEQYFAQKMTPLIDKINTLKARYRSRFWGTLWTVIFLVSINILFALFNVLIYKHPFNLEQLLVVIIGATIIILWPLLQYKKQHFPDIFGTFLQFYGDWQHTQSTEKRPISGSLPILPPHNLEQTMHTITGKYLGTDIMLSDIQYWQKSKKVSNGVLVELTFPQKVTDEILLFAKNGFYRKNKRVNMNLLNEQIFIPAAAYFNIFSPQPKAPKQLLCSPFFEKVLDTHDVFKAHLIYVALQANKVFIYLEGCQIYFAQNGIWQRKLDDSKFKSLHCKITEVLQFVELIQEIKARDE